jgi:peptide/nickel transport system permease protein
MFRYIIKRILVLIPLLVALSILSFIIIQLPPGDYLTTYINTLRSTGAQVDESTIERLEIQFGLHDPPAIQYFKWIGGIVRGNMGYSFLWQRRVNDLIAERLGTTLMLSLTSLALIWVIAFPLGFYSATHQYTPLDSLSRSVSFLGMSIPEFMLALVFMWLFYKLTGTYAGGMYSDKYVNLPMSFGKFLDLLRHMWMPYLIIAITGTAGLFKVFRANLIDEITKPYMKTAIAKGLSYQRALIKYPVRIALIPFISTVGWALPGLISGQTILAIVMDLPTVAPLLNGALKNQDMYLGSAIIMILGTLTMLGTLVSDILLAVVDPRVRSSL